MIIISSFTVGGLIYKLDKSVKPAQNLQPEPTTPFPENIPTPTPTEIAQNGVEILPTNIPTPTIDPDPFIICKSKTGDLLVKKSTCDTYTDCPDGYGGFVFESKEACKSRWNQISKNLMAAVEAYKNALIEQSKIQSELLKLQLEGASQDTINNIQQKLDKINQEIAESNRRYQEELQKINQQSRDYFKNFIKLPSPTPTKAGGAGRMNDPREWRYR